MTISTAEAKAQTAEAKAQAAHRSMVRVLNALLEALWPAMPEPPGATPAQTRFYTLPGNHNPELAEEVRQPLLHDKHSVWR